MAQSTAPSRMLAGRIATILAAITALGGGLSPVIAHMDISSAAGVIAGVIAAAGIVIKWLDGWQKYEERERLIAVGELGATPHDPHRTSSQEVDETSAYGEVNPVTGMTDVEVERAIAAPPIIDESAPTQAA